MKDRLEEIATAAGRRPGARPARRRCRSRPTRLDASGPVRPYELEVAVERLCLDSTSLPQHPRALRRRPRRGWPRGSSRSSPTRGKMHNPETDSGGILLGTVAAVGERLRIAAGGRRRAIVDPRLADADAAAARRGHRARPRLAPGRGRAAPPTSSSARAWARAARRPPARRPRSSSSTSAPRPRRRATWRRADGTVCVLGAGHAGKLALAARPRRDGRRHARRGRRRRRPRSSAVAELGLCDIGVAADLRDPLAALEALRAAGVAAGRPDGRRRQRDRLRAGGDPAHRRRRDGPLLLDGDELLSAPRWPPTGSAPSARMLDRQRLRARPRRLRARPRARARAPLREALGPRSEEPGVSGDGHEHAVQMRWRDLDGLGHVNHTVVLTYLEEGRDAFLRGARDQPRRVRRRPLLGRASTARSTRRSGRSRSSARSRELGTLERDDQRADPRRRRRGRRRGRVRARPLGSRARAARGRSPTTERAALAGSGEEAADERLEQRPGRRHLRHHRRRRLPREQPEHPVHDRGDRRLGDRGGGGRRDDRPPARARGRRHAERPPGAVRRRDRPHPRRLRRADDGLDRRRQRHDDRGADHRPRGEAGHLRGRVGLDELRRRDLHHPAAGGPRDRRAGDRARASRSRSRPSTSATSSAPCAGSRRGSSRPPMRINLVFGVPGRDRRLARGARRDAPPAAARDVLDRDLHRPPPPADARRWRCCTGAPGIRTGLEDVAYISKGVLAPSNAALVEMAVGLARHARPRGRDPGAGEGAAGAWLSEAIAASSAGSRRPRAAARPETREAIDRAAVELFARLGYHATSMRAIAAAAQVQPAAIYHWYPSKEAILVQLQDDFMERLTEQRRGRDGAPASAPRCGSPRRSASTSSSTASTGRRRSSPTARSGRSTDGPRAALIAKRDDYQEMLRRADPRRHPRRLAARVRRARRDLRDPAAVHGGRALVRPGGAARRSSRSPSSTSSSCSARCGAPELIAEAIATSRAPEAVARDDRERSSRRRCPRRRRSPSSRRRARRRPARRPSRRSPTSRRAATRSSSAPTTARSTATSPAPTRSAPPTCSGRCREPGHRHGPRALRAATGRARLHDLIDWDAVGEPAHRLRLQRHHRAAPGARRPRRLGHLLRPQLPALHAQEGRADQGDRGVVPPRLPARAARPRVRGPGGPLRAHGRRGGRRGRRWSAAA